MTGEESIPTVATAASTALFGVGVQYYGTEKQEIERSIDEHNRSLRRAKRDKEDAVKAISKYIRKGDSERRNYYREKKTEAQKKITDVEQKLKEAKREKSRLR
jgi:hypothetical protein